MKLQLRRMTFAREISALPVDLLELHTILMQHRGRHNEDIYMFVSVWNKMHVYQRFYESFKFSSEAEFLVYYDLPDGTTLARWTVLVELFDKQTFILLGDTVLLFMTQLVSIKQEDTDLRKKDYQAIFDQYCKGNDNFDKTSFYRTVRHYVEEKYEKLEREQEGMTQEEWRKKKETSKTGTSWRRGTKPAPESQSYGPKVSRDFTWKQEQCSVCREHIKREEEMLKHIGKLEALIERRLGKHAVPERPASIRGLA